MQTQQRMPQTPQEGFSLYKWGDGRFLKLSDLTVVYESEQGCSARNVGPAGGLDTPSATCDSPHHAIPVLPTGHRESPAQAIIVVNSVIPHVCIHLI